MRIPQAKGWSRGRGTLGNQDRTRCEYTLTTVRDDTRLKLRGIINQFENTAPQKILSLWSNKLQCLALSRSRAVQCAEYYHGMIEGLVTRVGLKVPISTNSNPTSADSACRCAIRYVTSNHRRHHHYPGTYTTALKLCNGSCTSACRRFARLRPLILTVALDAEFFSLGVFRFPGPG